MSAPDPSRGRRTSGGLARGVAALAVAAALSLALGVTAARSQPKSPVTITAGGQEATILADEIRQIGGANELLLATGNVEITQGESRLLADRVELNRDTGTAVAQGRVVFFDGQDRLVGERIDYNLKTGTGVVYNASTFSPPYYRLSAERMDRVGPGLYNLYRGSFTTCEGDEPAWAFKMGTGTVALDDVAYGQNASLWVADKVPLIPWVPFFGAALRRERQSGFLYPEFGESSKKGLFTKIPYYWAISDSQDLTVALDTYTRRGLGVEGEYRYILSQKARGDFSGFFIREFLRDEQDRVRLDIPENRGFFSFKHDWQITPRLSFKVDANAATDDLVYREYGDLLRERARQRAETNVFLTQHWDTWSLVANILWYQDLTVPVATELQRVPEIKLLGLRQPVPGLPVLQYQTEASFTNFIRAVGSGGARADFHPRVFMPIPVGGLFTLTPFVGGRTTFYNERAVGLSVTRGVTIEDTIHEDRVRLQAEGGVEAETRASRVYDLGGTGGIDALQHVIEPRATLLEIRGINQKALPQYDRDIDKIGRVNQITYSLTNRLNAKTVAGPDGQPVRWELARLDLIQNFNIRKAISQVQPFEDLRAQLIVQPTMMFRFRADAAYDMYGRGFRYANTDVTATYRDVSASFGSRYDAVAGANYLTGQVTAKILANLDGHVAIGYDVRHGASVENRFGFDWRFQCFSISAEYVNRSKNENEFHVSVGLLGIGELGSKVGATK
jgi:LPS-assembly protein